MTEDDRIDFGKSKIAPLFNSIFYPTLLSMVFASLFTVADGIFVGQGVGSNALAAINIVSPSRTLGLRYVCCSEV